MSEDFGPNFITLTDEDGNEFELELLDTIDYKDKQYMAFLPADMDEDDPDYGMIILEALEEENGDQYFGSVDDEALLAEVYDYFMEQLFSDEDEDEADDD